MLKSPKTSLAVAATQLLLPKSNLLSRAARTYWLSGTSPPRLSHQLLLEPHLEALHLPSG